MLKYFQHQLGVAAMMPVPGLKLDHREVNWNRIYPEDAWQQINDDKTLI